MSKQRSQAKDTDTEVYMSWHKICINEEVIPSDRVMHASAGHGSRGK